MQVTRKIAAAVAVATVATLGLATAVSANMLGDTKGLGDAKTVAKDYGKGKHWYWVQKDGGLVSVDDNNVGPFQVCHNNVPVNVLGVQVPVNDVVGIVGIDQDANTATAVETCELESEQHNRSGKWYQMGDDGLLSVSNNNVGPFQVCHNNVPVNVLGVQVPVNDINALLGLDQNANGVDRLETCELENEQHN